MALQSSTMSDAVRTQEPHADLEPLMASVEQRLTDLQSALSARDMPCIELHAGELQKALSLAVERFMQAARRGGPPLPLRRRLGLASAQVAAQRDALARATAALDRAIDVLMPEQGSALYSPSGAHHPRRSRSSIEA
jgi:uncharacterized membrane protein YccC